MANCARFSGVQSVFAPASTRMKRPPTAGMNVAMAGRSTPFRMRILTLDAATAAPVCPAEMTASALPSAASVAQTVMEECFFARIEVVEGSPISTTSSAWTSWRCGPSFRCSF